MALAQRRARRPRHKLEVDFERLLDLVSLVDGDRDAQHLRDLAALELDLVRHGSVVFARDCGAVDRGVLDLDGPRRAVLPRDRHVDEALRLQDADLQVLLQEPDLARLVVVDDGHHRVHRLVRALEVERAALDLVQLDLELLVLLDLLVVEDLDRDVLVVLAVREVQHALLRLEIEPRLGGALDRGELHLELADRRVAQHGELDERLRLEHGVLGADGAGRVAEEHARLRLLRAAVGLVLDRDRLGLGRHDALLARHAAHRLHAQLRARRLGLVLHCELHDDLRGLLLAQAVRVDLLQQLDRLARVVVLAADLDDVHRGRDLGVAEPVLVGTVRRGDENGEEDEREERLGHVDDFRRPRHEQDDEQPHVRKDGRERRDLEHAHVGDHARLAVRDAADAHGGDDEQVERRRADDGRRAELAGDEVAEQDLVHREQDLGRRRAERHEREVRDGRVPDLDRHLARRAVRVLGVDDLLGRRDDLDRRHEHVGDNADREERPDQPDEVDDDFQAIGPVHDAVRDPRIGRHFVAHVDVRVAAPVLDFGAGPREEDAFAALRAPSPAPRHTRERETSEQRFGSEMRFARRAAPR